MKKFYKMSKFEFDSKDFVDTYKTGYFRDEKSIVYISQKSSRFVENEIMRYLQEAPKTAEDVKKILAWKIGKIRHKESEEKKEIIYSSDWENDFDVKLYNTDIVDFEKFAQYIVDHFSEFSSTSKDDPQSVLNELAKRSPERIGSVHLVTLLFFISSGQYPIFDQYACKALIAIKKGLEPYDNTSYKPLPGKDSSGFRTLYKDILCGYREDIEKIFGTEYKENRDIDRALWVYGHMFM